MSTAPTLRAALAAHRFGLAEPRLLGIGGDPTGWLLSQVGPADAPYGDDLVSSVAGLRRFYEFARERRELRRPAASSDAADAAEMAKSTEAQFGEHFRAIVDADLKSRIATAALTQRPFAERTRDVLGQPLHRVDGEGEARGMVGAFEREAIRPHIAGSFEQLADERGQACRHAALPRQRAVGRTEFARGRRARSPCAAPQRRRREPRAPRLTGLNENLAREVLELHTLGVQGGYTPADVTAFARVLTGWRVPGPNQIGELSGTTRPFRCRLARARRQDRARQDAIREGAQALDEVLHDLAHHPSTARFIAHQARAPFRRRRSAACAGRAARRARSRAAAANCRPCIATLVKRPKAGSRSREAEDAGGVRALDGARAGLGERIVRRADATPASRRWGNACRPRRRLPAGPTAPKNGSAPKRCGNASNGPRGLPNAWAAGRCANARAREPRPAAQRVHRRQIERAADAAAGAGAAVDGARNSSADEDTDDFTDFGR